VSAAAKAAMMLVVSLFTYPDFPSGETGPVDLDAFDL
jgi:hypothetical protein